jgi:hypothetical protein
MFRLQLGLKLTVDSSMDLALLSIFASPEDEYITFYVLIPSFNSI